MNDNDRGAASPRYHALLRKMNLEPSTERYETIADDSVPEMLSR
jgi:hypothetical protein